jgi:hypothetical protein
MKGIFVSDGMRGTRGIKRVSKFNSSVTRASMMRVSRRVIVNLVA